MITQNLFNQKPKTFMDYEPGKVPSKKEWGTQTKTESNVYDPFVSNIKIVGDDVTEKDYDTFFVGFNSVNDIPFRKEKQSVQKPAIRDTLYRPSVDGKPTIQNLPYRPSEDGEDKLNLYSEKTPTYIQARNTSQKSAETVWDAIKEYGKRLPQNIYPAIVSATTPFPTSLLRAAIGKTLENHVKEKHYGRNQYNVDLPKSEAEAIEWGWRTEIADCHQFTAPSTEEQNIKYISPDGKREIIFDCDGNVVTADEDMGTYNYASPDLEIAHLIADILPWIVYGNTPGDTTEWYGRIGGALKNGK